MNKLAQAILFGGSLALSGAVLADHPVEGFEGDLRDVDGGAASSVGNVSGSISVQDGRYEDQSGRRADVSDDEAEELNSDKHANGDDNTANDVQKVGGTQVDGGLQISSGSEFNGSQLEKGAVVFEPYWYGSSEAMKMEVGGEYGTRKGDDAGTVNAKGLLYGKADPLNVSLDGVIVEPVGLGLENEGSLLP